MSDIIKINNDIKSRNFKPVYFLFGDEGYYIDKITQLVEQTVLTEDEKAFNQTILYGRDTTFGEIISCARRFPMMADYQLLIIKEAQNLNKNFDDFLIYLENPQPTTIIVINYRADKVDGRKKVFKKLKEVGVWFESKKMYENQIPDWIIKVLKGNNYNIDPKAAFMLAEFLGTDLSKISNELEKLKISFQPGHTFTPHDVEENIGISKDYNLFELRKALGEKNQLKAYSIIDNFSQIQKNNPLVLINTQLFSFFSGLYKLHTAADKSERNVAALLGVHPFFVKEYFVAARNYPMKKISQIIEIIKTADLLSKGVGARVDYHDVLKEMVYKILN